MAERLRLISSEELMNRAFDMQEWRETIDRVMDALQLATKDRHGTEGVSEVLCKGFL